MKWINKTGVESDRGFTVQSIDRFIIEYREGEKKIQVYVENGFIAGGRPCVIIAESDAFKHWHGSASEELSLSKQKEIFLNFKEAMEFQGIAVVSPEAGPE